MVHRAHPLNCETSIPALMGGVIMPSARFYVRNHFQIHKLDPDSYRLRVAGLIEQPLELNLRQLRGIGVHLLRVTAEGLLDELVPLGDLQKPDLGDRQRHRYTVLCSSC